MCAVREKLVEAETPDTNKKDQLALALSSYDQEDQSCYGCRSGLKPLLGESWPEDNYAYQNEKPSRILVTPQCRDHPSQPWRAAPQFGYSLGVWLPQLPVPTGVRRFQRLDGNRGGNATFFEQLPEIQTW